MRFLERGVQKWQQSITQLQVLANDGFIIFSETPWFLIVAIVLLVIATKRRQKTDLIGADQQFTIAASDKTADITADKGFAGKAKGSKHGDVQSQRIPGALCIAGPHG